eukprot:c16620_g1_i1 orf=309-581(+)
MKKKIHTLAIVFLSSLDVLLSLGRRKVPISSDGYANATNFLHKGSLCIISCISVRVVNLRIFNTTALFCNTVSSSVMLSRLLSSNSTFIK